MSLNYRNAHTSFALKMLNEGHSQIKSHLCKMKPVQKDPNFWAILIECAATRHGKSKANLEILNVIENDSHFQKLSPGLFDEVINSAMSSSKRACISKIMTMQEADTYSPSTRTRDNLKWELRREKWPAIDLIWPAMAQNPDYGPELLSAICRPWFLKNPARAASFSNIPLGDAEVKYISTGLAKSLHNTLTGCSENQKKMVAKSLLLLIDKGCVDADIMKTQAGSYYKQTPTPVDLFLVEIQVDRLDASTPGARAKSSVRRM